MTFMISSGDSSGYFTCSVGISWLMLRSVFGFGMTGSFPVSSVAWNLQGGSCGSSFMLLSSVSLSNPVISTSTIVRPLRSVKIN